MSALNVYFFLNKYSIFLSLMETAGLYDVLKEKGAHTIFAPTDEAFKNLTEEDIALLKSECCFVKLFFSAE